MMTTVALQFDEIIGLLANAGFVWALLVATWGAVSYSFMRHRRHGPKVGPSQTAGAVSFSLTKPRLSEEEIFRICESPKTAREISKGLGDIYPGHKEKGFPAEKLGEHLANLERLGAVKFNGEKWAASDIGVKMVRKYFG